MEDLPQGRVHAVLVSRDGERFSRLTGRLDLAVGEGILGDRHAGGRRSDPRERVLRQIRVARGASIANVRQFSAVSLEELTAIKRAMGAPAEPPGYGLLGENLIVSGIPDFSALPPGTLLTFGRTSPSGEVATGAVLAVWARNEACKVPDRNFAEFYGTPGCPFVAQEGFVSAARECRGLVGFVYCAGVIEPGDTVTAWRPDHA
jgi:hypothetical protein